MRGASLSVAGLLGGAGPLDADLARAGRIALSAMLAARHLERPVDLARVLEMALAQALPGTPEQVRDGLDPDDGVHVFALVLELHTAGTAEARLVQALGDLIDGRKPEPKMRTGFFALSAA